MADDTLSTRTAHMNPPFPTMVITPRIFVLFTPHPPTKSTPKHMVKPWKIRPITRVYMCVYPFPAQGSNQYHPYPLLEWRGELNLLANVIESFSFLLLTHSLLFLLSQTFFHLMIYLYRLLNGLSKSRKKLISFFEGWDGQHHSLISSQSVENWPSYINNLKF